MRAVERSDQMKQLGLLVSVILLNGLLATPASGQIDVNINIGAPPPAVVLHSTPTMVFLPEPGVHVLVDAPYDLYFIGGRDY
jgi:hypothetical protein